MTARIAHARSIDNPDPGKIDYQNIGELLFRQARYYDTKPYLIFYDLAGNRTQLGYKDFFALVSQCANVMHAHGIRRGDRVATISHNHSDTVLQYFAAWLMGVCVVPVSLSEDDHRIRYILENSQAKLAFLRSDYSERILPILASVPTVASVLLCGVDVPGSFEDSVDQASPFYTSQEAVTISDEALIVYTSGTTGNPKGVVLTQYNLLCDARGITEWHAMTNSQRMMCVLPIHHVNGTVVTLVTPMYFGGTVILNQKFQSEHFFERIVNERVNVVSVVPTLLAFLLEYSRTNGTHRLDKSNESNESALSTLHSPLSTLRHIICGAGPLTVELAQEFEETFGISIVHGYGLSETTCYSCFLPIDLTPEQHRHWMRDFGFPAIGVAIPQNNMMIADERGHELPAGEKGEIAIRGVNVMKYYYENADANEKTFNYGWFRSGDEGFYQLDDQTRKFFFITGRLKELIIRGGVNISPLEIDEVLARCPGVKAAIAVGFENDFYGEEVGAYVQPNEGASLNADDVIAFCRTELPHAKAPKVIVFGSDIPVTSTGKYQRNKCKPLFREWKTAQFRKG
ncbi:MAG: class I adenylate-forming enzyme family protein [Bacteroidota bacterium]|nr:class I adenylate-forming enzyme family protein [Bacteroidota bacterium]MDP4233683.1 class I adenylate-forming enzyme family protein [Bacteroidota bacterium]MDP4241860.1 class I adenylate-forming enzyme family protein [Bacteroidota bacterium]MDP4288952.1 class I adenylate-forming enzyme family protein [Bacteroidota bacterium]